MVAPSSLLVEKKMKKKAVSFRNDEGLDSFANVKPFSLFYIDYSSFYAIMEP